MSSRDPLAEGIARDLDLASAQVAAALARFAAAMAESIASVLADLGQAQSIAKAMRRSLEAARVEGGALLQVKPANQERRPELLIWTPERCDLLRRCWTTHTAAAIRASLNKLPGAAPIKTDKAIRIHANRLGCRRSRFPQLLDTPPEIDGSVDAVDGSVDVIDAPPEPSTPASSMSDTTLMSQDHPGSVEAPEPHIAVHIQAPLAHIQAPSAYIPPPERQIVAPEPVAAPSPPASIVTRPAPVRRPPITPEMLAAIRAKPPGYCADGQRADDSFIRAWAEQRGLRQGISLDLGSINAKRAQLGLPPFIREAVVPPARPAESRAAAR